ncbi:MULTISPECIES: serine/threonine-protein kinase [Actinomadura]|uniref:non-specific serine/threonine protein kinase n=1 Tax=Actinomadura yumaensis TaxID=111807 RepID=A0ABW2CR10_9ACTN|nr:serine/threonine-protein kinase [Actinomadura sp. J1-007]
MPNETSGERLLARRYRLVTQVGRGGMGTVWQAHDEVLGRDVAVKEVILPHGLTDEERAVQYKRTFREARTAARLGHPGVVTVYDVVEEDGRPWIIMELIRSRSLDQVIKQEGPLGIRRAADIGRQMLAALHAAHDAGVLHRDVKPSNVLVTGTGRQDDRAVLTDFGIATASGDATLTQTGLVMGSPAYIAPERARGRVAGPASDLWSLGVTLYAMVHGKSPFERPEPMAALVAVISEEPDPPEKAGRLAPVIEGLLRKNPDQRMDAIEAGALLDDIVRQESVDTQRTLAVEVSLEELMGQAPPAEDAAREMPVQEPVREERLAKKLRPSRRERSQDRAPKRPQERPRSQSRDQPAPGPSETVSDPYAAEEGPPPAPPAPPAADGRTRVAPTVGDGGDGRTGPGGDTAPDPVTDAGAGDDPNVTRVDRGAAARPSRDRERDRDTTGDIANDPARATSWHQGPATEPAGSGVPPATGPSDRPTLRSLASNRNAVLIGVAVLVLIIVIAAVALANSGGDGGKPAKKQAASTPPKSPAPATSAPPSSAKPNPPSVPEGFRLHKDRTGYSVAVPKDWSGPKRKKYGDFFYSPDDRSYIQIAQTDDPGPSALTDWEKQENGGSGWNGYHRIKIAKTGDQPPVPDTGSGAKSADWEFTHQTGKGRMHILNRGFVANGHGYAILLSAPHDGWDGTFAELQPVYRSFKPASD